MAMHGDRDDELRLFQTGEHPCGYWSDRVARDLVLDPNDRRLSRVFLTRKGRELLAELVPLHAAHVGDLLSALDPAERREMRRLLGKLRQSLATTQTARPESRNGTKE